MINGMYLSTMGAMVEMAKHENVANNLANSETSGFKPDYATFQDIPAESVWKGLNRRESDLILEKTGGGVWMDRTMTDFSPGPMRETRNPLDLAINDKQGEVSFFKVQMQGENGESVGYTRNGNFVINSAGTLVTTDGTPVLDDNNQTITIPSGGKVEVNRNGDIEVVINGASNLVGRVGLATTTLAEAQRGLKKLGNSIFEVNGAQMNDGQGDIVSGMLEQSSTDPIYEMVNMIEGHRMYEQNMRFLKIQDSTLGTAISKLTAK